MHEELASTWSSVRDELRRDVPDFKFHMWLEPLRLAGVDGGTLYVRAPEHLRTWVRDRYLLLIRQAASRALGPSALVEIVGEDWAPPPPSRARQGAAAHSQSHDSPDPDELRLRPKYTFEQFVIGASNRFAHAAA